jgi:predicted AlkP superfamily phosphohydrolase/phosphomutase
MELKGNDEKVLAQMDALAEMNLGVMQLLLRKGPWDLFIGVFTTPDRCQHLFWDRRETVVRAHYRKVDSCVGRLLQEIGDDALVVLLSDHGFQDIDTKFYMNRWLGERGWLATRTVEDSETGQGEFDELFGILRPTEVRPGFVGRLLGRKGPSVVVDRARSKAWLHSLLTNGVKISPEVKGAERESLRNAIVAGLRELKHPDSNRPLFEWVKTREEAYHGPCLDWAPDVVTKAEGSRLQFGRNAEPGKVIRVSRHPQGNHSDTGILAIRGPGARKGPVEGARLVDVMPTICWALGHPVPPGLDGKVLTQCFEPAVVAAHPVKVGTATAATAGPVVPASTEAEEEELRKTLEGLGYL